MRVFTQAGPTLAACLLTLLLSLGVWSGQAQASPAWGGLDGAFAPPQGFAAYFVGSGKRDRATEMRLTSDGRIVIAGYTHNGTDNDLLVMRFLANGSLDTDFGAGQGYVIFGGAGDQLALGLALQNDQKIVLTGRTSSSGNNEALTLRLNADGSLDSSFGDQGKAVFSGQAGGTDTGRAVEIQPDGKILVAGELSLGAEKNAMVLRYLSSGELDASFGQGGLATLAGTGKADDWAFDLLVQADGGILVTGAASTDQTEDIMLWRLDSAGVSDPGFASGGLAVWAGSGGQRDYGNAIALDPQGRILVAGAEHDGQNYNIVVLAFLQDGGLDASFGQAGVARYQSPNGGYDYAWGLAVTDEGRILVSGTTAGPDGESPSIICFMPDGTLDQSFAEQGVFQLSSAGGTGRIYDVVVKNDGRVLGAGYLNQGGRDQVLLLGLTGR